MKKLIVLILTVATVLSASFVMTSAADTTTLTTTVPDATYTLNIPENKAIPFGTTDTDIGKVTVTNSSGFAEGKSLEVTMTYEAFKAEGVSTTIPYTIYGFQTVDRSNDYPIYSGGSVVFTGKDDGTCDEGRYGGLKIIINSTDWDKALAGEYSSVITFTAEVVIETD